jgi:hypothetical protein
MNEMCREDFGLCEGKEILSPLAKRGTVYLCRTKSLHDERKNDDECNEVRKQQPGLGSSIKDTV